MLHTCLNPQKTEVLRLTGQVEITITWPVELYDLIEIRNLQDQVLCIGCVVKKLPNSKAILEICDD